MVLNCFLVFIFCLASLSLEAKEKQNSLPETTSLSTIDSQKSKIEVLARSAEWLSLGHYKKNFDGYFSSLEKKFFLHSQGEKNPELELKESLNLLFFSSENNKELQCKYPSRTQFLKVNFDIPIEKLHPCPHIDEWKKNLNVDSIFLVFASNDLNSITSGFGHTFLRLHNKDNIRKNDLLDYGVNYAANTGADSGAMLALKGLFGHYPGVFSMLPFHQKMIEYTNLEGRDLWEYQLKLNPEQIDLILNHLLEIDGIKSPYYFISENCSQAILDLLSIVYFNAELSEHFKVATFPLDSVKLLNEKNLLQGEKYRTSLQSEWIVSYKQLNSLQKDILQETLESRNFELSNKYLNLSSTEKGQILEAALKYLAIQEYKEKKDFSEAKYKISITRAQLGKVTEPLKFEKPENPLNSHSSSAFYIGHGVKDGDQFSSLKYRWAYQDILSSDKGLTPFAHIEIFSPEIRYSHLDNSFQWESLTFIKLINLDPSTSLDRRLSWHLNIGFENEMSPLIDYGVGSSVELNYFKKTRLAGFLRQKNIFYKDDLQSYLGPQIFLTTNITKNIKLISSYSYLWHFQDEKIYSESATGISLTADKFELRLTSQWTEQTPEFLLQIIF